MSNIKLPAGYNLLSLQSTVSTNDEAIKYAINGAKDRTIVWSLEQISGRGRQGHTWDSLNGNLFCSVILRPNCMLIIASQISFLTAVAIADTITSITSIPCYCKWPNDILIRERKIAGILLESRLISQYIIDWIVVGVGINIRAFPLSLANKATALSTLGVQIDISTVLQIYIERLEYYLHLWELNGFDIIRNLWLKLAIGIGSFITVKIFQKTLNGLFSGIDQDGSLLLIQTNHLTPIRITAGEIFIHHKL